MAMEGQPRCNCMNTNCINCYCSCFHGKGFCSHPCNCQDCWNREDRRTFVEEHAELRLGTKPGACQSKDSALTGDKNHVKGCTCTKSGCKKNYCLCFKKQVACTARCKCQGCENSHGTGGKGFQENGDPGGSPGKPNGASDGGDGSPGGSGESAVVTDEELPGPTEAGAVENIAAIADPQDPSTHIHGVGVPQTLTHEAPTTTTRRVPMQVEIDEADQLQNIGDRYDFTWH